MKVAITGGSGFIGRHLVSRCLAEGNEVRVLSRRSVNARLTHRVTWYQGDLNDPSSLLALVDGVDILYHCAGQITNKSQMRSLHVDGTKNLIDVASDRIGHWVQLSSVGVYGAVSRGLITEASPINPIGEYEETKLESDELVLAAAKKGKFSCTVLRPSNVFGEEMSNQSLFAMIHMIKRGLFFFVGAAGASANYIHVDNVVEGLFRCGTIKTAKGGIYNLSDHCSMEFLVEVVSGELKCGRLPLRIPESLVRGIVWCLGSIPNFPLSQPRVDALTNHAIYPIDRIQYELGYEHVISMKRGLQQLVAAYNRRK